MRLPQVGHRAAPAINLNLRPIRFRGRSQAIEAAKNVVMMDVALLNAEIKRHVQEARRNPRRIRYEPLAPDVRAVIVQSWRNFGLLPAAPIEEMVPEKAIRRY
jgi:hypothetical protein